MLIEGENGIVPVGGVADWWAHGVTRFVRASELPNAVRDVVEGEEPPRDPAALVVEDEEQPAAQPQAPATPTRRPNTINIEEQYGRLTRPLTPIRGSQRKSPKQSKSSRKIRRWQDLNTLIAENEITEEDIAPSNQSTNAFDRLFSSAEHMGNWYSFLRASEEQQRLLLAPQPRPTQEVPARTKNPVECYKRIDRCTRRLLRKSNIPSGLLEQLESDIQDYAEQDGTQAPVVWTLEDAFSRNIAHAVCQFYGLSSYSESIGAVRVTRVLFGTEPLVVPRKTLAQVLETLSGES